MRLGTVLLLLALFSSSPAVAATIQCGGADDTEVIQAALDAARSARGGDIGLVGRCPVRALNGRELVGVVIHGVSAYATSLIPLESGGIVLDLTDSYDVSLERLAIGQGLTGERPRVGLLTAQSHDTDWPSNLIHLDRVVISGIFEWAAWYNLGVASSTVTRSQFYNFTGGIGAVVFLAHNWPGLTSPFGPLMQGTFGPTDWTFVGSEFHNFGLGVALWIGGADSLRFFGGNMSVNGFPWHITLNIAGTLPTGPHLLFEGVTFYTDNGSTPVCAIQSNQGPVPLTDRSSLIQARQWSC